MIFLDSMVIGDKMHKSIFLKKYKTNFRNVIRMYSLLSD